VDTAPARPSGARMTHLFDDENWRHERFIVTVQQKAEISWDEAERATEAVLRTLGERIAAGEARELAAALPRPLHGPLLEPGGDAQPFEAREFVGRLAEREGTDPATAEKHARAVFVALARFAPLGEIADLGSDYAALLGDPAVPEPLPAGEFVERASARAGLYPSRGWRAVEAVLETIGERIAGGEVDDLISALPSELAPPLERGKARSGGKARRMSLDEFVDVVAEREGVTAEAALEHAQAVFLTLREVLPDKELSDLLDELPRGYQEALL
jgi:uncharacterized protein (DUF2267 family)